MARERDIRNAIQARLAATGAFDAVWLTGLPEDYGQAAGNLAAAVIETVATSFTIGWDNLPDGIVDYTDTLRVTLLARNQDPQLRDEACEAMVSHLTNTVNGQILVPGFTIPQKTSVISWQWLSPVAPERRIVASVHVGYLLTGGWDSFDTDP